MDRGVTRMISQLWICALCNFDHDDCKIGRQIAKPGLSLVDRPAISHAYSFVSVHCTHQCANSTHWKMAEQHAYILPYPQSSHYSMGTGHYWPMLAYAVCKTDFDWVWCSRSATEKVNKTIKKGLNVFPIWRYRLLKNFTGVTSTSWRPCLCLYLALYKLNLSPGCARVPRPPECVVRSVLL